MDIFGKAFWTVALLGTLASASAFAERPRVEFDRPNGFSVVQGAEGETVRASVAGGGGYWFGQNAWQCDGGGNPSPADPAVYELDTSLPGIYLLRVAGGCDGTDEPVRGFLRYRVLPSPAPAARAAQAGETQLWSEDFNSINNGTELTTSFNGWSGAKVFGVVSNSFTALRFGSGSASGCVTSPPVALGGHAGRVEFALWNYNTDTATAYLESSSDNGSSWSTLASYSSLPASATNCSVDLPAASSLLLRWRNTGSKQRFYLDDVAVYQGAAGTLPPSIDIEPDDIDIDIVLGSTPVTNSITVTATDFDGDVITLAATVLPPGAVWYADDPATGSVMGLFEWVPETTGTFTAVFAASDPNDGTSTVTVTFNVVPEGPGTLSFASDAAYFRENAGTATLTVVRELGAVGAVTVAWATADGTATAGTDYTAASGTLSFADGETFKTLTVALLDNASAQANRTFTVTLSPPTGGAALDTPSACTVTIVDDDSSTADFYAACYSNGVLRTGDDLRNVLHRLVNTTTNGVGVKSNTYSRVQTILETIDVPEGSSQVRCLYSQTGVSVSACNREHIWAQSHGIDEKLPGYTDLHHIRLCTESLNSKRADKDFDTCRGVSGAGSVSGCYYTSSAFEPPDAAKGDVARACFYMAVRYRGQYGTQVTLDLVDFTGTTSSGNQLGKLSPLLEWNELDPPDDFEKRRNELIYSSYQYNRNPFIDNPEWARAVFDPDNFNPETVTWTINVSIEGSGWVNNNDTSFSASAVNGTNKTFAIQPDTSSYYHIGSVSTNGVQVPPAYYTNLTYYPFTWSNVTDNRTLAVRFDPDLAPLGTPVWWLAELGYTADDGWDAAELEDLNNDGIPNWQEYLNGTDPMAQTLATPAGLAASSVASSGFGLSWNAVANAGSYGVRVSSVEPVQAAAATFETGAVDEGWSLSESKANVKTAAALEGSYGLSLGGNGTYLLSPAVANPVSATFKYKRSSNTTAWSLAVQVATPGGTDWTTVDTITNASQTAKTSTVDLSAWSDSTVCVRFLDTREEGSHERYIDSVSILSAPPVVFESNVTATSCTVTGLDPETAYDAVVRAEAANANPSAWSEALRVTTAAASSSTPYEDWVAAFTNLPAGFDATPSADPDDDGFTNHQEFLADTHPADAALHFALDAASASGSLVLAPSPLSAARAYSLLVYTNLNADPATLPVALSDGAFTVTPGDAPALFYRIRVTLP